MLKIAKKYKLLIFFVLLFVCSSTLAQRKVRKGDGTSQMIDFMLTVQDGVRLDCSKFIPFGNPPAGGWPCIVITHGFGLSKEESMDEAENMASNGYYSFVYSMRGQGESEGFSNFISSTEANDLKQVVQYIKNDQNTNDNKIAIHGGSQGGIIPYMAVCSGMQVHTIIPELASPEQGSNWIANGGNQMR